VQELSPKFADGAAFWQPVLKDQGTVVAVLAVYWEDHLEQLPGETRRALRLLALEAAIAIERGELLGRLEVAARTDDLTGLLNRRAWDTELGRELSRAAREGKPLGVAILDLDRFKQYNDAHGHQAGDRFLKQMAGSWSQSLRASDILARYGGEGFALALPGTDLDTAGGLLARPRNAPPAGPALLRAACARLPGISIEPLSGLLVDFAASHGAHCLALVHADRGHVQFGPLAFPPHEQPRRRAPPPHPELLLLCAHLRPPPPARRSAPALSSLQSGVTSQGGSRGLHPRLT